MIKIIESPRDAMQGIKTFIPTEKKIAFINSLLKVGFDILDFGSFVSPKAIPQLKDTAEVLQSLDLNNTKSKLLVIVANKKGGEIAASYNDITFLGFPYSISGQFLKLNINSTKNRSLDTIEELIEICAKKNKKLLIYISMAFGNPYGEPWHPDLLEECTAKLYEKGIRNINLSDTIGSASPMSIEESFKRLLPAFPEAEFSFHLHTTQKGWYDKINAAFENGCRSFDGVINGLGGCPMSGYDLVGNLSTTHLLEYFDTKGIPLNINIKAFEESRMQAAMTFPVFQD